MSDELIIALVAAIVTTLGMNGGWLLWKNQRAKLNAESKKLGAETGAITTGIALTMVKELRIHVKELKVHVKELKVHVKEQDNRIYCLTRRVEVLEDENYDLKKEKEGYREGAIQLEEQVKSMKGTPVYYVPRGVVRNAE